MASNLSEPRKKLHIHGKEKIKEFLLKAEKQSGHIPKCIKKSSCIEAESAIIDNTSNIPNEDIMENILSLDTFDDSEKDEPYRGFTILKSLYIDNTIYKSKKTHTPLYKDFQLLGDSQFVRFSTQMLNLGKDIILTPKTKRQIGYCVSGQKVEDLEQRLIENIIPLHENVILLIGTNNFLQGTNLRSMCECYQNILTYLKDTTKKIILITVPPIPKLENSSNYWHTFKKFNNFIESLQNNINIFVVDFASLLVKYDMTSSKEYFERTFLDGRLDLIHVNRNGFKLLQHVLDMHYFDKY